MFWSSFNSRIFLYLTDGTMQTASSLKCMSKLRPSKCLFYQSLHFHFSFIIIVTIWQFRVGACSIFCGKSSPPESVNRKNPLCATSYSQTNSKQPPIYISITHLSVIISFTVPRFHLKLTPEMRTTCFNPVMPKYHIGRAKFDALKFWFKHGNA